MNGQALVDIQETRSSKLVRTYLKHGYVLLSVDSVHYKNTSTDPAKATPPWLRGTQFVVGCPPDIRPIDAASAKDEAWGPRAGAIGNE